VGTDTHGFNARAFANQYLTRSSNNNKKRRVVLQPDTKKKRRVE
jgi:hypothetical protein